MSITRRSFLLGLFSMPAAAETLTLTISKEDMPRYKDERRLRDLLLLDIEDMDIHKQISFNLERIREEDKLYARIQSEDRQWSR